MEQATVMVMVSPELIKQLEDWSPPVQVKIVQDSSSPAGWEMITRQPVTE